MNKSNSSEILLTIYKLLYKKFGPQHWWPGETRLEIIVGAILTQNTAWGNVEKAISNLKKEGLLKAGALSRVPKKTLARLIRPSGYYNIKAQRIKNFLSFLNRDYNGKLHKMFATDMHKLKNELLAVKGIGPETADSILLYAGGKPAFVVDAYTKRIFSRHGFLKEDASYDEAQDFFKMNLPLDIRLFNEFHALIVKLGKDLCASKNPLCDKCPIGRINNG